MTMRQNSGMDIREHMEVVGEDGRHVGTVDKVEGSMIKLTKNDPEAGGKHHYIPMDLVSSTEGGKVRLMIPGDQALLEEDYEGPDSMDDSEAESGTNDAKASGDQPA